MEQIEVLISMAEWGAQNVAYNLDFIPDDKLQWRPAPDAQSALEIAHEIARSVDGASILFQTGELQRRVAEPKDARRSQTGNYGCSENLHHGVAVHLNRAVEQHR